MPTSHPYQLNEVVQIAELIQPRRILDVGIGYGKYGYLLREYLGLNKNLNKYELIIDGVEGSESYILPVHRETYNEIHLFDLTTDFALSDVRYDLSLLIDVIEHFDCATGIRILDWLVSISDCVLVATPWDIGDPSIRHDNPLEDHKYQWLKKDFDKYPHHRFVFNRNSLMVLIGKDNQLPERVAKKMSGRCVKNIYEFIRRSTGLKRG